ncbi:hypothetical protein [Lysobacter tyrosinilyticus]
MAGSDKINVFQFVALRAPEATDRPGSQREYVHDTGPLTRANHEYVDENGEVADYYVVSRAAREPFRPDSESAVGRLIYAELFEHTGGRTPRQTNDAVVAGVLAQMPTLQPQLGTMPAAGRSIDIVRQLQEHAHLAASAGNVFYLLPAQLSDVPSGGDWLPRLRTILWRHADDAAFDKALLFAELQALFSGSTDLWSAVYLQEGHQYDSTFQYARAVLWDTLYQLYILRRIVDVDLGEVMDGIRALHALELLAADACLEAVRAGTLPAFPGADYYATIFEGVYGEHAGLRANPARPDAVKFVASAEDLRKCLHAEVVIPPIVAELGYYAVGKFNSITPYLGDLKVVKQWLRGYRVGEIARIVNIMSGEEKTRSTQVTERRVDALSYTTDASETNTSERQSTDKYDIKQEAETALKTQLNVNANASTSIQYESGYKIQTNIGAGFAYANSGEVSRRSANAFAREVMDKAVSQVERRTSQSRSITTTYETIDKDRQKYTNTEQGARHVSGIYRWLDKRYEAQLFNYGKRWMLEFIIPEPAAFLVQARLQAAARDMRLPRPPEAPQLEGVDIRNPLTGQPLLAAQITTDVFDALAVRYDLSAFTYPAPTRKVSLINQANNTNMFSQANLGDDQWTSATYRVAMDEQAVDYALTQISARGYIEFTGRVGQGGGEDQTESKNDNYIVLTVDGTQVFDHADNGLGGWHWQPKIITVDALPISGAGLDLTIALQDGNHYGLTLDAELSLKDASRETFKIAVYNHIRQLEQDRVGPINEARRVAHESARSEYLNALAELRALTVNELIQGRSEAFNAGVIREELKRHCVSMIAHEFDADASDDVLVAIPGVGESPVQMTYPTFDAGDHNGQPYARFDTPSLEVEFPFLRIDEAARRGRLVQFLEQAFEWRQITYVTYPYFWARRPKWLEMMNRLDYADSAMSDFLRAGSARVLVAVTPGYYDAVMYFLATREPWSGGAAPVIGDPLFIPVHEEIRKQQDDLEGAKPEGDPWPFTVPTALLYLQDSSSPIPTDLADPAIPAIPA